LIVRLLIAASIILMPLSYAYAWTLYFQQDLGIKNGMRLCKYSDGNVYTFNATSLCELQIEGSAPGFGKGVGFLKGEQVQGLTKVCFYDVLGEQKALRFQAMTLCPLTTKF